MDEIKSPVSRHRAGSVDYPNLDRRYCSGVDSECRPDPCQLLNNAAETGNGKQDDYKWTHLAFIHNYKVLSLLLPIEGTTEHTLHSVPHSFFPSNLMVCFFSSCLLSSRYLGRYIHYTCLTSPALMQISAIEVTHQGRPNAVPPVYLQ